MTMKQFLAMLLLTISATAFAGPHHGHHGHWRSHGNGWVWVVPALIGGAVGYEIARNQPPVVMQPQAPAVIYTERGVYQTQNCSPWVETQQADGTIIRTRTCQ
jgi:hypothetical protein